MVRGRFTSFCHDHHFEAIGAGTRMIDELEFESPGWFIGELVNRLVLTDYLTNLLRQRNQTIKRAAEAASETSPI